MPLSRWSGPELAAELATQGLASAISPSSILRILAEHPLRPWQYQSWIFPRDPDFASKAAVILDLYQGYYQGQRLAPGDRILSVAPSRPAPAATLLRRPGLAGPCGWNTNTTGQVAAACPPATGIAPFMALMGQVMSQQPYASAPRVFVIVDNGSDHRGRATIRRLREAHPNAIMIHTPVHASWLIQVEIVFSIVQKKVISPNDFASTAQLAATLLAFTGRYNQNARPFNWKYTAADLTGLLQRISAHHEPASQTASLPGAA